MNARPAWLTKPLTATGLTRLTNLEVLHVVVGLATLLLSLAPFWSKPDYNISVNAWRGGMLDPVLLLGYLTPAALTVALLMYAYKDKGVTLWTLTRRQAAGVVYGLAAVVTWCAVFRSASTQYGLGTISAVGFGLWLTTLLTSAGAVATFAAHRFAFLAPDGSTRPVAATGGTHAAANLATGQDGTRQEWVAVEVPTPCFDPDTNSPAFTLEPGTWYLATTNDGQVSVQDDAGHTGQLTSDEGLIRA